MPCSLPQVLLEVTDVVGADIVGVAVATTVELGRSGAPVGEAGRRRCGSEPDARRVDDASADGRGEGAGSWAPSSRETGTHRASRRRPSPRAGRPVRTV